MADREHHEDDLNPTKTEGFKVGEKKTVEEYQQLGRSPYFYMLASVWLDWGDCGCLYAAGRCS